LHLYFYDEHGINIDKGFLFKDEAVILH